MKSAYRESVILLFGMIMAVAGYQAASRHDATNTGKSRETALERIKRTGIVRCGYTVSAPYLLKDPNTGAFSGIAYDFMNALARELDVRLEWREEVGWGTFHEGLNANRFDAMCVPVFQSGPRAKVALLSTPLYFNALYATVRADDDRFDTLESINRPNVRVAVIDGITQAVKRSLFPAAQEIAAPQLVDGSHLLLSVATRKADIGFENSDGLRRYNANAAVKLKFALKGKPVRYFANTLAVRTGETELKDALDATIEAITTDGTAEQLAQKYGQAFKSAAPGHVNLEN